MHGQVLDYRLLPSVLAALYIPFANRYGIICAMLFGGTLGMVWPRLQFCFLPLLPGFALSMALLITVSWLTRQRVPTR